MRFALDRPRTPARAVLCGALAALAALAAAPSARAECPNEAIRAAQGGDVLALPDCMALEQVNPPQKFNAYARAPQISADGQRVRFESNAALAGAPNLVDPLGDIYVATRGASGWSTVPTRPPAIFPKGWGSFGVAKSLTPDFSRWLHIASTQSQFGRGVGQAYRGGLEGLFAPLSPLLVPVAGVEEAGIGTELFVGRSSLEGVSSDHSHLYFQPGRPVSGPTTYLPGDPRPGGSDFDNHAYVAKLDAEGGPSLALMARDASNKVWGGRCGARLGGIGLGRTGESDRSQGALSLDGRRAFMSTRPAQAENADCDPAVSKMRILLRQESAQGISIAPLYSSECNRIAPACSPVDGDDRYQGASADGAKVYFTTNRQLASSDLDGSSAECRSAAPAISGCDLYLYDSEQPAGQRLIQVSAGESGGGHEAGKEAKVYDGTVAISGDGTHVYFAAEGVLTTRKGPEGESADELPASTPKLYLYQRDEAHPGGHLAFIGPLDPGDRSNGTLPGLWGAGDSWRNQAYPVPVLGKENGVEIGGDGHVLLFQSEASLTENDVDGSRLDIFRYDASSEELLCVSCRPAGPDGAPFDVVARRVQFPAGTEFAEEGRWVSEDARSVVFKTAEGMIPGDQNDVLDSYLWRDGRYARLPGTAAKSDATGQLRDIPVLSHDGSQVAFTSRVQLLPSDRDSATDTYVARSDGGFAEPEPEAVCAPGDGCLPPPPQPATPLDLTSESPKDSGEPPPGISPCGALARRAQGLSRRAKRSRRASRRVKAPRRARRLRRVSARSAKRARRVSQNAKRCRARRQR